MKIKKLFLLLTILLSAQSILAEDMTVSWSMSQGPNSVGIVNPTNAAINIEKTLGTDLTYLEETRTVNDISFCVIQGNDNYPQNNYSSVAASQSFIDFKFSPTGSFTAKQISFDIVKFGTSLPQIFVDIIDGNGNTSTLAENVDIQRNNLREDADINHSFTTNATAHSGQIFTLRIYIGKLASVKQIGIANVVISGTIDKGESSTEAESLSISDFSIDEGVQKEISVNLSNSSMNYCAFQFDLSLPEGLLISDARLNNERVNNTFSLSYVKRDSGNRYSIAVLSSNLSTITGTSGPLLYLDFMTSEGVVAGNYTGRIENILFVPTIGSKITFENSSFNISITNGSVIGICPTPTFSRDVNKLVISCNIPSATIYYTLDDSTPTRNSTKYEGPITLTQNSTVKAIAVADGYEDSEVATYIVDWFNISIPDFCVVNEDEVCAFFEAPTSWSSVSCWAWDSNNNYTGGSWPGVACTKVGVNNGKNVWKWSYSGTLSTQPAYIIFSNRSNGGQTADLVFVNRGYYNDDGTLQGVVTNVVVKIVCATPIFQRNGNNLTISSSTGGAIIYYTMDGSTPTKGSNVYTNPITLTQNCIVKAIAVADGYEDSNVASYSANWFKVDNVAISFVNLKVELSTPTANARIYYTTDGSTPTENSTRYTEPFAVSSNCIVKAIAYKDNFNASDVTSLYIDLDKVKCDTPTFQMSGNILTISTLTENTTIYYTLDGTMPTTSSEKYIGPVTLTRNGIVKALAVKEGYLNSEIGSYEVTYFQVEMPSFTVENNILTISCGTRGASIYYIIGDGTLELKEQNRYISPITLTDNRAVRAIGILDGYRNSEEAIYRHNSISCEDVTISFDGHYVYLSSTTDGATIYYTTNGSNPTNTSASYTGPVAVNALCTINAIAMKENMNNSKVAKMELSYVYDGTSVTVKEAGLLSNAFNWNQGTSKSKRLEVRGPLNTVDIEFIKSLSSVEHLDMKNVTLADQKLPDKAFANMNIISIELPSGLTQVGSNLFAQCPKLAAIVWNAECKLTEDVLSEIGNSNLLVYANSITYVPSGYNVINLVNNKASNIVLSDVRAGNGSFYCPRKFTAQKISYSRNFKMKSGMSESAGWETIALPFNVEKITHEKNGVLAPFNSNVAGSKPFWLYNVQNNDFNPAMEIVANTPYIICMPNHGNYAEEYNQGGVVEFSANNIEIMPTPTTAEDLSENGITLTPVFTAMSPSDKVYVVNFEEYEGHAPGNLFVRNLRTAYPFEAYLTINTASAPSYIPIFNNGHTTDISDIQLSKDKENDNWYTISGRKLQGRPTTKGVYINDKRKVIVR